MTLVLFVLAVVTIAVGAVLGYTAAHLQKARPHELEAVSAEAGDGLVVLQLEDRRAHRETWQIDARFAHYLSDQLLMTAARAAKRADTPVGWSGEAFDA